MRETGESRNGDKVKELAARLSRLTGLVIGIERRGAGSTQTVMLPLIASSNLPNNLTVHLKAESNGQESIPAMENPFGIQLEERFFQDVKKHQVAIPRRLWMQLQGQKGSSTHRSADAFVYRCYCAQSETVIPSTGLREQFPQSDNNPRRFKVSVKKALTPLRIVWPETRIDVVKEGVWLDRAVQPLLPDDPSKKRVRRLSAAD